MFSNKLIKSIAKTSDEKGLKLSKVDWDLVLKANQCFSEDPQRWKGDNLWGRFLLNRLGQDAEINFCNSLELCCGNGFVYFSLKNLVKFNDECYHMDLSRSQLDAFSTRCTKLNCQAPNIIYGDIGEIPFEDHKFRIVYGNSYLHHLPDVGKYLAEVVRVLHKGGKFIAFHEPTASAPFLETFPRSLLKKFDDGSLTDIWLIKPEVIKEIMINVGFSEVRIYPGGIFYSLLITPFYLLFAKIGFGFNNSFFTRAKISMDKLDAILPMNIRKKYSCSICIVGIK